MSKERINFGNYIMLLSKNKIFIYLIIFLEYLPILNYKISFLYTFFGEENINSNYLLYINYISPLFLFSKMGNCKDTYCSFSMTTILTVFTVVTLIFISFQIHMKKDNSQFQQVKIGSKCLLFFKGTNFITSNLIEVIIHVFGIFFMYLCFNNIINLGLEIYITHHTTIINTVLIILSMIFCVGFLIFYLKYLRRINSMIYLDEKITCHNDNLFSIKYDYILFTIKLLISIEKSLQPINTKFKSYKIGLSFSVLITSLMFALWIILEGMQKKPIYLINRKVNMIRIFLLNFSTSLLIITVLSPQFPNYVIDLIIINLTLLCFSILMSIWVDMRIAQGIYQTTNLVHQLVFINNMRQDHSISQIEKKLTRFFLKHQIFCTIKNSSIRGCLICSTKKISYWDILKTYRNQIKNDIKNYPTEFSEIDVEYYEIMKVFIQSEYLSQISKADFYFEIRKILNKNKLKSNSLYINCLILFNYVRLNIDPSKNIFKILEIFDETKNLFKEAIRLIKQLEYKVNSTPSIAISLGKVKKFITKNINSMLELRGVYFDIYSFSIFYYMFKSFFNDDLMNYKIYCETLVDDNFKDFFENDKFMLVLFNVRNSTLVIKKASREVASCLGKNFEEIFLEDFRTSTKKEFLLQIKENNNNEFFFQTVLNKNKINEANAEQRNYDFNQAQINTDYYNEKICDLKKIAFKCLIFPSFSYKYIFIFMEYKIFSKNIVIVERRAPRRMINISKNIQNLVQISPKILNLFSFDSIFTKVKEEKCNDKILNVYVLDYQKYFSYYLDTIKDFEFENVLNDLDDINGKARANKKIILKERRCYALDENHDWLEMKIKNEKIAEINKSNIIADKNSSIFSLDKFRSRADTFSQTNTSDSVRSTSSYSGESKNINYFNKKKITQLNTITIIAIIYSVILILLCFVFLIIGALNCQRLYDSYLTINYFNLLESVFYQLTISSFHNIALVGNNETEVSRITRDYYKKFNENPIIKISLRDYINNEIVSKLDLIDDRIQQVNTHIMKSYNKDKLYNIYYNKTAEFNKVSWIGDDLNVQKINNTFFDGIKEFSLKLKLLSGRRRVTNLKTIPIIKDGVYDFSNTKTVRNRNIVDVYAYDIIINHSIFHILFKSIKNDLENFHQNNVDSISFQTLMMIFIIIAVHLLFILIFLLIVGFYLSTLRLGLSIISKVLNQQGLVYLNKKMQILEKLNELYVENPSKLISRLKYLRLEFSTKRKDFFNKYEQIREDITLLNNEPKEVTRVAKNFDADIFSLLKAILMVIFYVFLSYFVYSAFFFVFLQFYSDQLEISSKMFYTYANYDLRVLNIFIISKLMMFTNTTDEYWGKEFASENQLRYIRDNINLIYMETYEMYKVENNMEFYSEIKTQQENFSCSRCFDPDLKDPVLEGLNNFYNTTPIILIQTSICEFFPIMKNKNAHYIIEHYSSNLKVILNSLEDLTMENFVRLYHSESMYDLSLMLIMIIRPIQLYITNTLMFSVELQYLNVYLILIVIYLCLNVLVDIVIFFIFKKYVIKIVLNNIKDINSLIEVIKR